MHAPELFVIRVDRYRTSGDLSGAEVAGLTADANRIAGVMTC